MSKPDDDLPPAAAASQRIGEAWLASSPKLVAEFRDLEKRLKHEGRWQYAGPPHNIEGYILSEFDSHGHKLQREQYAILAKIDESLLSKLRRGVLAAWAREGSPLGPWRAIPSSAWRVFKLGDLEAGTLTAPGVMLFDTRVGVPVDENASVPHRSETGAPGRPTSMHLIVLKLKERAKAGQLESGVMAEATTLAAWFKATYPHEPPATAKTIYNSIGSTYRDLTANKAKFPKL